MYLCKRCGYESKYKNCLEQHLNNKKECDPKNENLDRGVLLEELTIKNYNDFTFDCEFCERKFNSNSSKSRHKKICKAKISTSEEKIEELIKTVKDLKSEIKTIRNDISDENNSQQLKLDLQYYKNRKNEKFYQLLLEKYLGGTHKTLSCGITDVTTDTCHAEIKDWLSWKEAIGQLTCYNMVDPKETLDMYMFGKYKQSCKDEAIKITKGCNINMYEFVDLDDGISILSLENNEIIYNYRPEI